MSDQEFLQAKATYFGLMTEIDEQLGRIFDYLKATNQYESTLIVFTSDHGEQLGDHYLFGKLGYFDASYHIPLHHSGSKETIAESENLRAFFRICGCNADHPRLARIGDS